MLELELKFREGLLGDPANDSEEDETNVLESEVQKLHKQIADLQKEMSDQRQSYVKELIKRTQLQKETEN
jgi:polyhydroxyalkanoate synthesis regulator phasin